MRILTLVLVILLVFVTIEARRSGSRSSRSSQSSRSTSRGGSSCDDEECMYVGIGIGSAVGLVLIIVAIVCCYQHCRGKTKTRSKPWISNNSYVKYGCSSCCSSSSDETVFLSGFWNARIYRNFSWTGPHRLTLNFNPNSEQVTGTGTDNLGSFTIDGTFSPKTKRIAMTQTYRSDNGVESSPVTGKQLIIQLSYNASGKKFLGKWYEAVTTLKLDGDYELALDPGETQKPFMDKF